jgi:hypothetical protein
MENPLRTSEARAWTARLAELTTFTEGTPVNLTELATSAAEALAHFTGAAATVYRPIRQGAGFGVEFVARRGLPAAFVSDFRDLLAKTPSHLFLFDPTRPDPRERDVVRVLAPTELTAHASSQTALFRRYGMDGATQTRMLVCNGPMLLGWVGIFRDRPGAAARRDAWLVRSLGRALRRPLRLLHRLPRAGAALFEGALDVLPGDAYLVTRAGRVETANGKGAALLAAGFATRSAELAATVDAYMRGVTGPDFDVHPLRFRHGDVFIVHRREKPREMALAARLEEARARWALSSQQVVVLRELARGRAMQKSGTDSRLRLVAELWGAG